jgi:drug/metabolite transporter (DMT)-like permease
MKKAIFYAILAAALYALNAPVSKLLLQNVPLTMMAGFLYLGAGIGMAVMGLVRSGTGHGKQEMRLTKKDLPYTLGMVILDIAAPIFLMIGLTRTTAANASLLNNFEIVATSLIALLVFKERIGPRRLACIWAALVGIMLVSDLPSAVAGGVDPTGAALGLAAAVGAALVIVAVAAGELIQE